MAAPVDYDAPSRNQMLGDDENSANILGVLGIDTRSGVLDTDDGDLIGLTEQPGPLVADGWNWIPDDSTVRVVPQQANEFTCSRCFLIHPHSRLALHRHGQFVCRDCA